MSAISAVIFFGMCMVLIIVALASGAWIAVAIGCVGIGVLSFAGVNWGREYLGYMQFIVGNSFIWVCVPLFILMGHMILKSGLADKIYSGADKLVGFLPGGLLHTNVASCAVFAAISGSSTVTAATIGSVALPQLRERAYDLGLIAGTIGGGGTLGILIPPSLAMIIYGMVVGQPISKLFIAGVFPGIILALLFMGYVAAESKAHPHKVPKRVKFVPRRVPLALLELLPLLVIMLVVLGSIYLGLATPTESAALGAFLAVVFSAIYRRFSWQTLKESAVSAVELSSWVFLIVIMARALTMGLAWLQIPAILAHWATSLTVNRMWIFWGIILFYIVLGCFIEVVAMQLLTLPVIYPIMVSLGFDPIWFGVVQVLVIQMAQITPPVGICIYVLQGLMGSEFLPQIIRGMIPFFLLQIVMVGIIVLFPELATWLPMTMRAPGW